MGTGLARSVKPSARWWSERAARSMSVATTLGGLAREAVKAQAGSAPSPVPSFRERERGRCMTVQSSTDLQFRLLGPLEAEGTTGRVALGGAKPRALLADLLVHLGEVVSVDRLVEDLWSAGPPPSARHALEVHVSTLRKALALAGSSAAIVTQAPGYRLDAAPEVVDAALFERLVAEGK